MPVKLERKLKRQAAKDPSIKDKDAYVYGTMRKTGWKPSREKRKEKKMNDPSETIQFARRLPQLPPGAEWGKSKSGRLFTRNTGAEKALADAVRKLKANKKYNKFLDPMTYPPEKRVPWMSDPSKPIEFGILDLVRKAGKVFSGEARLAKISARDPGNLAAHESWLKTLPKERQDFFRAQGERDRQAAGKWSSLSAKLDRIIRFDIPTDEGTATIMQPFQGATTHESKIDQLEFPAGLSPLAALRLPLPQLMAYLNQRDHLRQVF